jgi:hypothetical protein
MCTHAALDRLSGMPSSHSLARLAIAVALLALLAGAVSCGAGHGLSGVSPLGAPDRPLRPAVVWRDWIASHDFTASRPDVPIGAELTVVVRDVTRPDIGLPGMRVDLITREASAELVAGATASSAGWRPWASPASADGVALPPLGVAGDVPYVARVQHDGYRPVDILVELLPSCRAVLEVYLQPGAPSAGAELPPPRAVLTTCRFPAPRAG